jgi:preprotein translocase subunit SecD
VGGTTEPTVTPAAPVEPGVSLILKLVPFEGDQAITLEVQEQARRVMEARAMEMGVANMAVRSDEPDLLIVELRGKDSSEETQRGLSRNGFIEIVDCGDEPLMEGALIVTSEGGPSFEEGAPQSLKVYQVVVTGREIVADKVAYVSNPTTGQPEVTFALNEEGARKFADFTAANVGKYMAVVLDKRVINAPRIVSPISAGEGSITGLTESGAKQLVTLLKAGVMPAKLELVETQQLGTSTNP